MLTKYIYYYSKPHLNNAMFLFWAYYTFVDGGEGLIDGRIGEIGILVG